MNSRDPYGFIYITTNLINGKKYIGKKEFKKGWKNYLGSGVNLKKAIKKYGRENFSRDIIYIAYSLEELNKAEQDFIYYHDAINDKDYYNIASGGDGGNTLKGLSDEELRLFKHRCRLTIKDKMKNKKPQIGKDNPFYGKYHTKEAKQKISKAKKGKTLSEETKYKMCEAHKGKTHTEESKEKMSKNTKTKKEIICLENRIVYESVTEASKKTGIDRANISACCRGKLKTAGGFHWMYYDVFLKDGVITYE